MNYWMLQYLKDIHPGDIVYWRKSCFSQRDWEKLIDNYGPLPFIVIRSYWEPVYREHRLELQDSDNQTILGIQPEKLCKVDDDFEAFY